MKNNIFKFFAILILASVTISAANATSKGEESPEIALMRLHFEYECANTKSCQDKVKTGRGSVGTKKFKFREYKVDNSAYKAVLAAKGKDKDKDKDKN